MGLRSPPSGAINARRPAHRPGLYSAVRAAVAQLARASACHAEGRGFESHQPLSRAPPVQVGSTRSRTHSRKWRLWPDSGPNASAVVFGAPALRLAATT